MARRASVDPDNNPTLLVEAAKRRGLAISRMGRLMSISRDDRTVTFWKGIPDTVSHVARSATGDKEVTKRILRRAGIKVPEGKVFDPTEKELGWELAQSLGRVVVKPLQGSGRKGVTVNIQSEDHCELAWTIAAKLAAQIIVEQYIAAKNDYRMLVIGGELYAATQRHPAFVRGDGRSSILQLIEQKNAQRQSNPYLGAKSMTISKSIAFNLEQAGRNGDTVLPDGEFLQLHRVANIGAGGETEDVTERVHPEFARLAVQATRAAFDSVHAGIDFLADDISASPDGQPWAVCELNLNPDLAMQHYPLIGQARDAAGALIDCLFGEGARPVAASAPLLAAGPEAGPRILARALKGARRGLKRLKPGR